MSEKKVVANTSKAYGYNYASLGDIANQGFEIPRMKTGTENEKEYVYCFDKDTKEWIRGAEIVIPQMKSMNTAQMYGSALTYARRYSVLMYLGLACDDDKKLETQAPKSNLWEGLEKQPSLKDAADEFRRTVPAEFQDKIIANFKVKRAEDLGIVNLQRYIEHYGKEQTDQG